MREDAGVDRARLLDLFAWRKVLVDTVYPHCARIVERNQDILRWNVGACVDGPRRQPYRCAVWRESASCRVDQKRGDVVLGPGRAITGSAAAGRNIEIASRYMRPCVLHGRGQGDRLTLDQLRAGDINVVVSQISPNVCIERDLVGRGLG